MAPLDWNRLMKLDIQELQDDTSLAEDMYTVLAEFDPESEADPKRLLKLFQVSQAIMVVKAVAAEVVEEQLNEQAMGEGRSTAKKDQEIADLKDEVRALKRELGDVKRFGADGSGLASLHDARILRDEIVELEAQVATVEKDLREKEQQLVEEKKNCDTYIGRAEEAEKKLHEFRNENDHLREDIRDYQRQLEAQRETLMSKREGDQLTRDAMSKKNKLLSDTLDENRHLWEEMGKLKGELEGMERKLIDGRIEIEKTMDDYMKLKSCVDMSDSALDALRRENGALKGQVEDLVAQVQTKSDADDEIMAQVNNKVEEWKGILADKELQIAEQRQQILHLREDLNVANMDADRKSVALLTKALEDKDKQMALLTSQLHDATDALEQNEKLLKDVDDKVLNTGRDPKNIHRRALANLQTTIVEHEEQLKDMERRTVTAEADAQEKDKLLNDLLIRMSQYEQGVYGLPEAIDEIKKLKEQVKQRDRTVEEYAGCINRCEDQINVLYDEVEELRERLGLDPREPINIEDVRRRKDLRINQDRALNRVLHKEIERMEDERLKLKLQVRELVKSSGQRLIDLPLDDTADDLFNTKRPIVIDRTGGRDGARNDDMNRKYQMLSADQERAARAMDQLSEENVASKTKNSELEMENRALEKAITEIREQLKSGGRSGGEPIQCLALDKYFEMLNTRNVVGRYDMAIVLKAQVDNLTGRNDELRRELHEVRFEAAKAHENLNKANSKLENLEEEVKSLREAGAGGWFQTMPLPEGMAVSSSEVIASLNEHLVVALQELSNREKLMEKMDSSLDNYRRKFAIVRHQQGLLYQEYAEAKKSWESESKLLKDQLSDVIGKKEEDDAKIREFERLLDTLAQDEPEVRRRLVEMTRTTTVLRVNETILSRKYTISQQVETALRQENSRLRKDMIAVESAITERLGYLQRYKDMASFKMAALQKALDDSVPAVELELANKQFTELTEKYRDKLESTKSLVAFKEEATGYQSEVKRLQDENNVLTKELSIEKEKLHVLEAAFERMRKQGTARSQDLEDNELISVAHRLTTLEMKELNERQRAEHASRMYEQQKTILRQLEDRNFELEQKFAELTRLNLEMQRVERELRDELANCVPKKVSDADRKRIADLETSEATLKNEVSKLREVSDVATTQVQTISAQQVSHDKELTSLRQQLVDIQAQSSEKTIIGKLHRHIVQLQFSEGTAVRLLNAAKSKITRLEALLLRTEQNADEKDRTIYHNKLESRNKIHHLKHTIQDLRRKFSGSVPLAQQEKFTELMIRLQDQQRSIEDDLKRTNDERRKVEDQLAEVELQRQGLAELLATLKDGRGAQKVIKWQQKMEAVALEDIRYKRDIERLKEQMRHLESLMKKHETEVLTLEEDKVRLRRDFESNELEWEQREVELERTIVKLEKQLTEIAGAASQFEEAVGCLPDASLPVAHQLEQAVDTIKRNVKLILDSKAQMDVYKKKVEEQEVKLREKDRELLNRDRVINELRLRLPATADRDAVFEKVTGSSQMAPRDEDYEASQAVRVATSTVSSLQARIAQKDEALARYQQLVEQVRQEMNDMTRRHDDEMRTMQEHLRVKNEAAFKKYKMAVRESLSKPDKAVATNEQLKRLNELEDIVAEQDNAMAALREKLSQSHQECQQLKFHYEEALQHALDEKQGFREECNEEVRKVAEEKAEVEHRLNELRKERDSTQRELEEQKEANSRAPTQTMKSLVERLKNQLALKEKQQQALSKALLDLRADLVNQAQSDVLLHAEQAAAEINVQKLVDKKTKDLQERIDELEEQNQKLRTDARRLRDRDSEMVDIRDELAKKEQQMKKLRDEKSALTFEVDELRSKVQRMSTMNRQRPESEAFHQEMDELRRKNTQLVKELEKLRSQPEKPFDHAPLLSHREESVAKWEDGKKWQKKVETLKSQCRDKDSEIERLTKANEMLKHAFDRANHEKEGLEARLRTAGGLEAVIKPSSAGTLGAAAPASSGATSSGKDGSSHSLQELKKRNDRLEDEVATLKRQLLVGRDSAMDEVQMRNKFLSDKLEKLEQMMSTRQPGGSSQDRGIEYRELAQREEQLQKQLIKLSEENMELRFEVEQSNKDIPRLKERYDEQQKYIEILKAEKQQLELMGRASRDSFSSLLSSPSGSIRRIGESGRTPEQLEKAVAVLKKVVEKTRAENERLKKTPAFTSADQLNQLQAENTDLKSQLDELRQKVGASLSDRYVSHQKGTAKVVADYEKLRKDLTKERETSEKLRLQVRDLQISLEQQTAAAAAAATGRDHSRERTEQQRPTDTLSGSQDDLKRSGSTHDVRALKLKARLCEEKIKELEQDLDKRSKQLSDMKILLRDSAAREQQLMRDNQDLEEKISILERLPAGSKVSDTELMKEYQLSRLRNERLENEKKELLHELLTLRRRVNPAAGGPQDVSEDEILTKLKTYDRLQTENTELQMKVKLLQLDKDKLHTEADKLKKELSNFNPEFFEEIEDLKYHCHEAVEKNKLYEEQLLKLSRQFGVAVNIPGR